MNRVLFVIPTLNEAGNIVALCREILNLDENWDILVVDDGSSDGTPELVMAMEFSGSSRLNVLQRGKRLGIGSAHKDGLKSAILREYEFAVTMDADGSHEPASAQSILDGCTSHDICVGSRYLQSNSLAGWSLGRKILTHLVHQLTMASLGLKYDNSSGFRAYRISTISDLSLDRIQSANYDFFFESLLFFQRNGLKINQASITLPTRTYGHSKLSFKLAVSALLTLIKLTYKYRIVPNGVEKREERGRP